MEDIEARLIGALPLPLPLPFNEERSIEDGGKSSVAPSSSFTLPTVDATELRVRRTAFEGYGVLLVLISSRALSQRDRLVAAKTWH
jgi:hypothetical protein